MADRLGAWILVVVLGLLALLSGFLGAVSHLARERAEVGALRLLDIAAAQLPVWPWYLLTPLLMTATFLAIQRAHDRTPTVRNDVTSATSERDVTDENRT